MHQENLNRLKEYFLSRGITAALLSNPFNLTWLTGYAPPIQTGPSPFEGGPALGWWQEGELTLILSDGEAGAAEACGANVRPYVGFTLDHPLDGTNRQAAALRELLGEHAALTGKVGVELNFLPAAIAAVAYTTLGRATFRPLDGALDPLRAVKTPQEIAKIRAALKLCDLAQTVIRQQTLPGITELALWGAMEGRLEAAAGTRLPILADLVGGARTAEIGGLPTSYCLQVGDPLILDVVPRLEGYWGDNAATYFAGEPSVELAKVYELVHDTLQRGIDAVRPGLRASEVDALLRESIRAGGYEPYPHHSGHGLGAAYHEEPRLVPLNDTLLEPGMVIAIEPGVYLPGNGGVRLEHTVLVTADGCEVMTQHLT
jgi:Xaa-Pro dipeptidase